MKSFRQILEDIKKSRVDEMRNGKIMGTEDFSSTDPYTTEIMLERKCKVQPFEQ
jgi:hypothetical protein